MTHHLRLIILCSALVGGLAACESGYRGVTSGSSIGPAGYAQTGYDSCVHSCDNTHARCMDKSSAHRVANEDVTTIYGAGADCEADLRACLPKCRAR